MNVKQFVGLCANRNTEVIIKNYDGFIIASGTVRGMIFDNGFKFLLNEDFLIHEKEVDCFYFANEKLYIVLR
jgi:hypothetical protein